MDVLPYHFRILRYFGLWYLSDEKYLPLKKLYTLLVITIILSFTGLQITAAVLGRNNMKIVVDALPAALTYVSFSLKTLNFICRKKSLNKLFNDFRICQAESLAESDIILKSQNLSTKVYKYYMTLVHITGFSVMLIPILKSETKNNKFPYEIYVPFDINSVTYPMIYAYEMILNCLGIFIHITLDCLVFSILCLIGGQLDLCCFRILNWTEKMKHTSSTELIKNHIIHYHIIKDMIKKTEAIFMPIIVIFFMCCLLSICYLLFRGVQTSATIGEMAALFLYIITLINETFLYCWFGNELTLKSKQLLDSLYQSNWIEVKQKYTKNYIILMLMNKKEMTMSYYGQCVLSLQTYSSIMKSTYTIFNLLRSTSST